MSFKNSIKLKTPIIIEFLDWRLKTIVSRLNEKTNLKR